MSAASSPNPTNLALLAVLGIGAYWMLTRRATAGQLFTNTQSGVSNPYRNSPSQIGALGGGLLGALVRNFSGNGTYDGRAATPWDVTPVDGGQAFNNPSAYVSTAVDGVAYNPPTSSPYDAASYGLDGSGGAFWN